MRGSFKDVKDEASIDRGNNIEINHFNVRTRSRRFRFGCLEPTPEPFLEQVPADNKGRTEPAEHDGFGNGNHSGSGNSLEGTAKEYRQEVTIQLLRIINRVQGTAEAAGYSGRQTGNAMQRDENRGTEYNDKYKYKSSLLRINTRRQHQGR